MYKIEEMTQTHIDEVCVAARGLVRDLLDAGIRAAVADAQKAEAEGFRVNIVVEVGPVKEADGEPGPLCLSVKSDTVVQLKRKAALKPMEIARGPLLPGIAEEE